MALVIKYVNPLYDGPELRELCAAADTAPASNDEIIKHDNTTTLLKTTINDRQIIIKRYNTKNWWHCLRRNFQKTRASNCWRMAELFQSVGLSTPHTVAVIESRIGPIAGKSWYLSEHHDSELLLDYLNVPDWHSRFEQVADLVMQIFNSLNRHRLSHGDMKATNILVSDDSLMLIDMDASRRHRFGWTHSRALNRDKARFLKNWDNLPALRQCFVERFAVMGM